MVKCPYCSREFTNAKRHATHVSTCKSNPRSEAAMALGAVPVNAATSSAAPFAPFAPFPTVVDLDGAQYFRADELVPFFPGAKGGRDVIDKGGVPEDKHAYATLAPKRGVWTSSSDKVKVARALVRVEWARANIPALERGPATATASTTTKQTPTIAEVVDTLRLKAAELDLGRAQITLLSAQASERRAAEMHVKELDALERRTDAYVASLTRRVSGSE